MRNIFLLLILCSSSAAAQTADSLSFIDFINKDSLAIHSNHRADSIKFQLEKLPTHEKSKDSTLRVASFAIKTAVLSASDQGIDTGAQHFLSFIVIADSSQRAGRNRQAFDVVARKIARREINESAREAESTHADSGIDLPVLRTYTIPIDNNDSSRYQVLTNAEYEQIKHLLTVYKCNQNLLKWYNTVELQTDSWSTKAHKRGQCIKFITQSCTKP